LIKQALEAQKPVLMLSIGPSRADGLPGVEKIEMKAGTVLEGVLERYIAYVRLCADAWGLLICCSAKQGPVVEEVKALMSKGVVKVPDQAPTPRAEG
jgi:NAD-dependent deacetylase sirtuin 4